MSQNATFGIILGAIAVVAVLADYLIDAWYDSVDRRAYRRRTKEAALLAKTSDKFK
jgi:hypothetical protein